MLVSTSSVLKFFMPISQTVRSFVELEVVKEIISTLGHFKSYLWCVSCTIAEESIAMNNTELYSENDCADSDNSDTGHGEPYCEDNITTNNVVLKAVYRNHLPSFYLE